MKKLKFVFMSLAFVGLIGCTDDDDDPAPSITDVNKEWAVESNSLTANGDAFEIVDEKDVDVNNRLDAAYMEVGQDQFNASPKKPKFSLYPASTSGAEFENGLQISGSQLEDLTDWSFTYTPIRSDGTAGTIQTAALVPAEAQGSITVTDMTESLTHASGLFMIEFTFDDLLVTNSLYQGSSTQGTITQGSSTLLNGVLRLQIK